MMNAAAAMPAHAAVETEFGTSPFRARKSLSLFWDNWAKGFQKTYTI